MPKKSAGLIMYRFNHSRLEILLVHPGGPYWSKKDDGAWSIPKGEYADNEEPLDAAKREFKEETGCEADGYFIPLPSIRQPGGKVIAAWAVEGECDAAGIRSNRFTMEWPPGAGKEVEFPEVDRAGWFSIEAAKKKLLKGQTKWIEQLCEALECDPGGNP